MSNAHFAGDFWQLPPAPRNPVEPEIAGGLLRKVRVDPVAMARALVLIKSFAVRHGIGEDEEQRIAVFVREDDILLAADWDRGRTRTIDGRERPFRFRYFVPIIESDGGLAISAGAYVRPQDLQEAFRNRVENSEHYGILSKPVTLEVYASDNSDGRPIYPARIVVHPTDDGSLEPRVVYTLAGASLDSFEDIEPQLADGGFPDLSADAMIEIASFATPEIGVRICPWQYVRVRGSDKDERVVARQGAYLVAVGRTGVAVTTFDSPLQETEREEEAKGPQRQLFDEARVHVDDVKQKKAVNASDEHRVLAGDLVCSPRFLHVLGITQAAFEEVKRSRERMRNADRDVKLIAAAVAASMDVLSAEKRFHAQRTICRHVGEPIVLAWTAKVQDGDVSAAIRFARALSRELEPHLVIEVADELESVYGPASIDEDTRQRLRVELSSDSAAIRAAALAIAHGSKVFAQSVAEFVGKARIRQAARDLAIELVTKAEDLDEEFQYRYAAFALAAVRAANRDYSRIAEALIDLVGEDEYAIWWKHFGNRLRELELPDELVRHVIFHSDGVTPRTGRPNVKDFRSTPKMRESWIRSAQLPVQGRIWRGVDGRAYAGFGDESAGWVLISDLAVDPDPERYPLSHEEVRALLASGLEEVEWEGRFYSNDLQSVVNRVVGLANPERTGEDPQTLLIARWTPPAHESPDGELPDRIRTFPRGTNPLTPRTVFVQDGPNLRRFEIERTGEEAQVADRSVAGTFRIYGVEDGGEMLWFDVPLEAEPRVWNAKSVYAFALDADRLHDAVGFITDKGRKAVLSAQNGVVRVRDYGNTRMVFVPTVSMTQAPPSFRTVLAAAEVPVTFENPVFIRAVIERARQLPRLSVANSGRDVSLYHGDPNSIIWADWDGNLEDRPEPGGGLYESVPQLLARLRIHRATLTRLDKERESRRYAKHVQVAQTDLWGETPVIQLERVQTLRAIDAKRYNLRKEIKNIIDQLAELIDLPEETLQDGPFHKGVQHIQVATAAHLDPEGEEWMAEDHHDTSREEADQQLERPSTKNVQRHSRASRTHLRRG